MLRNVCSKKIAYFVGFLAGDGGFNGGYGKRADRIGVTTTDLEVVDWISHNIQEFSKDNPKLNDNKCKGIFARLPAYCKVFSPRDTESLKCYGIVCKKEHRLHQNISKQDMRYFLLGLFDADGCITWGERKDKGRIYGKVNFTHPSIKLLGKVQIYLSEELGIVSTIVPKKDEKCFILAFSNLPSVKRFCEFIYSDQSAIVLPRKYHKYLELKSEIERLTSEGVSYPREFIDSYEYHSLIGSLSKFMFIDGHGVEYPSIKSIADKYGIEKGIARQRCEKLQMGWCRRPKTHQEVEDYKKYTKKKIKIAYKEWLEHNEVW